jgi:hypothetical protein
VGEPADLMLKYCWIVYGWAAACTAAKNETRNSAIKLRFISYAPKKKRITRFEPHYPLTFFRFAMLILISGGLLFRQRNAHFLERRLVERTRNLQAFGSLVFFQSGPCIGIQLACLVAGVHRFRL